MTVSKVDPVTRLKAFDALLELKNSGLARGEIIEIISSQYGISPFALYPWYSGTIPWERKGKVEMVPELFYVLGALLGDDCAYHWKKTKPYVILSGDEIFAKNASMVSVCIKSTATAYISRTQNIWFVRSNNFGFNQGAC